MEKRAGLSDENALKLLGGYVDNYKRGAINYYRLSDGRNVALKYSKLFDDGVGYWFGVTPSAIMQYKENITHFILILGYEGIVTLPISILLKYITNANTTLKSDGKIKHYHIRVKFDKEIILHNKIDKIDLKDHYFYEEKAIYNELNSKSKTDILNEANKFKDYEEQYKNSENGSKIRKESKAQKERIAILEDHTCQVCGFHEAYLSKHGTPSWIIDVDHIIDKALGGGETCGNLWALCPNCHRKKTHGVIVIDPIKKIVTERGKLIKINDNHLNW